MGNKFPWSARKSDVENAINFEYYEIFAFYIYSRPAALLRDEYSSICLIMEREGERKGLEFFNPIMTGFLQAHVKGVLFMHTGLDDGHVRMDGRR